MYTKSTSVSMVLLSPYIPVSGLISHHLVSSLHMDYIDVKGSSV